MFRQAIEDNWIPALNQFKPDIILVSAGFDAHIEDGISQLQLIDNDYWWISQQIRKIARKYSQDRIISVLEGGYALDALGRSVSAYIQGLIGENIKETNL